MKTLAIFDYKDAVIHLYNVDRDAEYKINNEYVQGLGYNLENCQWTLDDLKIIKHKGILV